jgi:hypothetical protein
LLRINCKPSKIAEGLEPNKKKSIQTAGLARMSIPVPEEWIPPTHAMKQAITG